MLQGILVDEAIEVLFQGAGDFGGTPGAWAIHESLRALGGKTMDPSSQRGIGKVQCIRDRLEALSCYDVADRLSTPEHTGLLGLLQEGL